MIKGTVAIGGAFGFTCLMWAVASPPDGLPASGQVTQLLGGLALTGFAAMFALATRARVLDGLFDGLDKAYVVHKWLGIVTVGVVLAHFATHGGAGHSAQGYEAQGLVAQEHGPERWGVAAMVAFVVLVVVALVAKKMSYEIWKTVHGLMAVAYVVGLVHYYRTSQYGPWGTGLFSLWLDLVNLVGVASAVYAVLGYERLAFRHTYQVTGLRQVGTNNLEITASPTGRTLTWKPGQFTFVKVPRIAFGSHPFTIATAPGDDGTVQLAIRALGDHTAALAGSLRVGDRLVTAAAHGKFDFMTGRPDQVWIAGGIGITPFRSFLHSGVPATYSVDLFYAFDGESGAYLDELASIAGDVRVHLVDTTQAGFLTADQIAQTVTCDRPVDVYFCGPAPMRDALKHALRTSPLDVRGFHYEEFGFGR